MEKKMYDLSIIGSGPAGMAASVYASRYKLDHLIFGAGDGGQMAEIHQIENWPGDISVSGSDLISRFRDHVEKYGVNINHESVVSLKKNEDGTFGVITGQGEYSTKTLLLAMGAEYRKINIPGEKEFIGRGVSYCATCDAMFFKDKTVAVVGGGNSAAVVALELTDFCSKIYVVFRKDKMTAEPIWIDRIRENSKIELVSGTNILEIKGENKVEKIILDKPREDKTFLEVDGVFVEVGSDPGVSLARNLGVETDEQNYIKVGQDQLTNVPGVFAAGDITNGSNKFRQIITAAAEGSIAAASAYKMLKLK